MKLYGTPDELRGRKNDLFATYQSIQDVINYAQTTEGPVAALVASMIMHNTLLELLAKEQEQNDGQLE